MRKILLVVVIMALPLLLNQCASSNPCSGGGCGSTASADACCGTNSYTGNWF